MRRAVGALIRKDLRLELRTRESVPAMVLFSLGTFVLFHFALDRPSVDGDLAAGVLWVTLLFAAVLGINRLFVAEEADLPAHRPALARQLAAEHLDLAAVRAQQRGEDPQQRGLAGAVGAEHGQGLTRVQSERDAGERHALAVRAADVSQLDRSHGATSPLAGCAPRA